MMMIHSGGVERIQWTAAMATLVCLAVLIGVIAAARASGRERSGGTARRGGLGVVCLILGLLLVAGWTHIRLNPVAGLFRPSVRHHGLVRLFSHPAAEAPTVAADVPATLPSVDRHAATATTPEEPEPAAGSDAPEAPRDAPNVEEDPSELPDAPEASADVADAPLGRGLLDGALPLELRAQVQIDYAARPAWVEQADQDVGPVHQIAVSSGPYLQSRLARRALDAQVKRAADEYICELVGSSRAAEWLAYDAAGLRQRLVARDHIFDEQVISPSFGRMHQSHALLELSPEFHQEVEQAWRVVCARAQLAKVALGVAGVLGTLLLVTAYFRTDTATQGRYRRRLQFVTLVAILGLVASGILAARSIPWLWP